MSKIQSQLKDVKPTCSCSVQAMEPEYLSSGPYYVHLGHARDLAEMRRNMQERTGLTEEEVRIEKVRYRRKEGKTSHGCPIAKYVSRVKIVFLSCNLKVASPILMVTLEIQQEFVIHICRVHDTKFYSRLFGGGQKRSSF